MELLMMLQAANTETKHPLVMAIAVLAQIVVLMHPSYQIQFHFICQGNQAQRISIIRFSVVQV